MEWLRSRIARQPKKAVVLGKTLLAAGGTLVLGAVTARAALMNVNAERVAAKLPPLRTLAEAWPQYPTWIVPEGPVGYAIAAALVIAGMVLVALAEKATKPPRAW